MHQLQLQITDQLYDQAQRRAVQAGFKTVEEYAADVLASDLDEEMDVFFTPERIAHIDRVVADLDQGGERLSLDEVRAGLANNRAAGIQKNAP